MNRKVQKATTDLERTRLVNRPRSFTKTLFACAERYNHGAATDALLAGDTVSLEGILTDNASTLCVLCMDRFPDPFRTVITKECVMDG